jgi:uncharacterized membrane protein
MRMIQRYRLSSFVLSSSWLVPLFSMVLALVLLQVVRRLDAAIGWDFLGFGLEGARALLAMLAASMLTILVFLFSAVMIVAQLASTQLTPRVVATILIRDRSAKFSIGVILLTFMLSVGVLGRSETEVLQASMFLCVLLSLVSIAMFLYMVDYILKSLRPVSVVDHIATLGRGVVEEVYPDLRNVVRDTTRTVLSAKPGPPDRTLLHEDTSAVLLAVDLRWLSEIAQQAQGLIELVPPVGAFIAVDEPLFHLYGGAARLDERSLRRALAFGRERTIEQDPTFAFRILVDIAAKALSPAINDPTTAVLAIDQIHRLLRTVGKRHLDTEAMLDASGRFGVAFHTPEWEDYVTLAISETRQYGATSLQVVRRLRAMIENLRTALPPDRWPPLEAQLRMLDRAVQRVFPDPEDRLSAGASDLQGVGFVE